MSGAFPALRTSSLRSNVAEVLRNALLEGKFRPGEELSDTALAAEFQVSRGPVREALLVLAEEGLVVHSHNRGFAAPRLGAEDLVSIAMVRKPLEVLALQLARTRVSAEDLSRLAALKEDLLAAYRQGGVRVCAMPDLAFHSAVWELSNNPWLHGTLRRLSLPYFAYVSVFQLGRPDQSEELMGEMHQRYIDCLSGGGGESIEECVTFHLDLRNGAR
jgi:DNA-binding GntR family transcriptional regulator